MKYLVKKNRKSVAHVWTGADTACTMWSTGGLKESKYEVVDAALLTEDELRNICQNCTRFGGLL